MSVVGPTEIFFARSAALRPGKPKPGLPGAAAREPSAERKGAFLYLPGIYASARAARLGDMPGYFRSSLAGLQHSGWVVCSMPRYSEDTAESGCATRAWKILKRRFQNGLVSESGFVKLSYFAWFLREIFVDGRTCFAYNSSGNTCQTVGHRWVDSNRRFWKLLEVDWYDRERHRGKIQPLAFST